MGCIGCGGNHVKFDTIWTCRVCELVDKDSSKKKVAHCETCQAYICEKCWHNYPRRALAFGKNIAKNAGDSIKKVFKI